MSAHAVFVDTSVLCNLLAIPHKCQNRDPIGPSSRCDGLAPS